MKEEIPDPIIENSFEDVYSPSDDTFMVIDFFRRSISEDLFDGLPIKEINNILDIGTGTGIIAIFIQSLNLPKLNIFASDILQNAISCAKLNEKNNNLKNNITFIHSDLFNSFPNYLKNSFEIVIFNPPYLPSIENSKFKSMDKTWDGGPEGLELLFRFFSQVKNYLNLQKKSHVYYVCSSATNLNKLYKFIEENGFDNIVLDKQHIFFEDIFLNRATLSQI